MCIRDSLIRSLKAKGHEVRVICPDADKAGEDGYYIVKTLNVGPFNNYVKKNGVNISKPDKKVVAKALKGVDAVHVMAVSYTHLDVYKRQLLKLGKFLSHKQKLSSRMSHHKCIRRLKVFKFI